MRHNNSKSGNFLSPGSSFILSFFISTALYGSDFDGLVYLNQLRTAAGLNPLNHNSVLESAAKRHADYLSGVYGSYSTHLGHSEDNYSYPDTHYSGRTSGDRGIAAGYKSLYYLENLSTGQRSLHRSIDGLFGAIYHRFGFLDPNIDEIGIGTNTDNKNYPVYNYNMGISGLNAICDSSISKPSGIYGVCADRGLVVDGREYINALNGNALNNPKIVIWPPAGSVGIPPAFYEESPDPLPNYSVSGYPVSIEFNDRHYSRVDSVNFILYDENGSVITDAIEMDSYSDPNGKFSSFQFALFPLKRLSRKSRYKVEVYYTALTQSKSYESETLSWEFTTRGQD